MIYNHEHNNEPSLNEAEANTSADNNYDYNYNDNANTYPDDFRLFANYPSPEELSASHTVGRVELDSKMNLGELVKVLCDTGALSANYVAADLIKRLESKLSNKRFFKTKCKVTLADSRTIKNINRGVKLKLVLKDPLAQKYEYTGDFFILDMKKNDIILGLPALTGKLFPFMQALLVKAHEDALKHTATKKQKLQEEALAAIDTKARDSASNNLKYPWSKREQEPAMEDKEVELPVNFGDALTFLGKSREEAILDFKKLQDEHVSDELKQQTDIINYLNTTALPAFVPSDWTGIKGIPPLRLKWKASLPSRMKPKARPINPKLWECSEKEFRRLCGYFYEASRSPWASCLVVAPKATPPYIRFCGDYVEVNKHMEVGNYTIPNVKHELAKIIDFPLYLDIDLTNAFHQIPLHEETSARLSIQTPWGQFQPKFMPEGIAPATGVLQETVKSIFADFEEWAIVIFDNMLILCTDAQDAFKKFQVIIERCLERNLVLKMAKSWLGFRKVEFFGYTCRHKSYEVAANKKEALNNIEFPTTTKKARSLLGKGVFFASFTPNYSTLTGHLTDLTKKTFNWNESTWKHDYRKEYVDFIKGLQGACELFYPDYNLDWTLRTDASELGVGAVLLQRKILEDNKEVLQPVAFVAKKFSDAAKKWSTIEQEAYGIFYAVRTLAYYLIGREFIVETDHNNLLWMEASEVPKIVRWRIFLQSFNFKLKHISGKLNDVADWFSRTFPDDTPEEHLAHIQQELYAMEVDDEDRRSICEYHDWLLNLYDDYKLSKSASPNIDKLDDSQLETESDKAYSQEECLKAVHNGKVGHMGARVTWTRLNKQFPGHGISYQIAQEFVAACPNCNKTRLGMKDTLVPIIRTLKPPESRTAIGIDAVEISPHGEDGYTHINVVVNLYTKFVALYPVKGVTALNLANSCWKYWCNFGHTDMIISDRGPDLVSGLYEQLTTYMGMRHTFSIADKHANGVERTIGEVFRHLRAMVYDESANSANQDIFKDPSWIDSVQYILNSEVNSETGYTPFELTYGSDVAKEYMKFAKGELSEKPHARLSKLNADLIQLQAKSKLIQDKLIASRKADGVLPEKQNKFQEGDYVLFDKGAKVHPKVNHRYLGPYTVKGQKANDVTVQHLATGQVKTFDVCDLKLYAGNKQEAYDMARRDQDQHVIDKILYCKGDAHTRTTLVFTVRFAAGDTVEIPYSKDLFDSIPYEDFCNSRPYWRHLRLSVKEASKYIQRINKQNLIGYRVDQEVYLDIRVYGDGWFNNLQLPDADTITYVSKFIITKHAPRKLHMINPITKDHHAFNPYNVFCFVHTEFNESSMVVIDEAFMVKYPQVTQEGRER
jgi:hypothetical protein